MEAVAGALLAGVRTTLELLWDSLFGLILGFLISAAAQVVFTRGALHRLLGTGAPGVIRGAAFGIVASACSYGAAAAARGLYAKGADIRAVLAFLVSSTNMNLAILILFWTLLGWRFAFAEFAGGIIIIAVVSVGFSALFGRDLTALAAAEQPIGTAGADNCHSCGSIDATEEERTELRALLRQDTWRRILATAWGDVAMLRTELTVGFLVAGFAAALVPSEWLAGALRAIGAVPFVGYLLLLLLGLGLAVVTFVCSMGNVPIARYLAMAGIPLGANTTFIYGDLLIPPLVAIYRKSFPPRVVWAFLGLFILGALIAGAAMDALIGGALGGVSMGSMALSDRVTLVSNLLALAALAAVVLYARIWTPQAAAAEKSTV